MMDNSLLWTQDDFPGDIECLWQTVVVEEFVNSFKNGEADE